MERLWTSVVEGPVVLSPRDWARITHWHERGIPLQVVQEAVEEEAARRGGGPRSLARVQRAVEETWSVVCQGRLAEPAGETGDAERARAPDAVCAWHRRANDEPSGSVLAALLGELLARLAAGEEPGAVDAELDRRLPAAAPSGLVERVERTVARDLDRFRDRLAASGLETARLAAIAGRLRRALDLPRLSLGSDEG